MWCKGDEVYLEQEKVDYAELLNPPKQSPALFLLLMAAGGFVAEVWNEYEEF